MGKLQHGTRVTCAVTEHGRLLDQSNRIDHRVKSCAGGPVIDLFVAQESSEPVVLLVLGDKRREQWYGEGNQRGRARND